MIFIPLPFVVALLLLILLVALLRNQEHLSSNRPFLILIGLSAFQAVIIGLRWGYGIADLRYILPVSASCFPPLVLASFRSLVGREDAYPAGVRWHQWMPPIGIVLIMVLIPKLLDAALIALFIGYAVAVLNLGRAGPDALEEARFEGAVAAHRALIVAAAYLCLSAAFDFAVLLDLEWGKGEIATLIAGNGNLLGLLLLGLMATVAAQARAFPATATDAAEAESIAVQDRDILRRVDRLLTDQKLFRDENLTLSRLARRAGMPARQISGSVNRLARKNVSQYINEFRIAEACRLLKETDLSVTAAMFEAGFQTKSNFNREFRRITSLSPASWRERNRPPQPLSSGPDGT